jgi:hypothetical protein
MELLTAVRDKHRTRFTNRINVDLHSAGGWSPEFWTQAEVSDDLGGVKRVKSITYIVSNPTGRTLPVAYHHTSPDLIGLRSYLSVPGFLAPYSALHSAGNLTAVTHS